MLRSTRKHHEFLMTMVALLQAGRTRSGTLLVYTARFLSRYLGAMMDRTLPQQCPNVQIQYINTSYREWLSHQAYMQETRHMLCQHACCAMLTLALRFLACSAAHTAPVSLFQSHGALFA